MNPDDLNLSVIIPTLNEENNLALLIADLKNWHYEIEMIIVDCGSSDNTLAIAKSCSTKTLYVDHPNRGLQMDLGSKKSSGKWLLFLHADSRLPEGWVEKVYKRIKYSSSLETAWFFNLKINKKNFLLRVLELFVYLRSNILKRPYGDQGLLISKELYKKVGGFKPICLMEDLDIIERISKKNKIKSLGTFIITSGRRWENSNAIKQSIKNALLRWRWRQGDSSYSLHKEYYKK